MTGRRLGHLLLAAAGLLVALLPLTLGPTGSMTCRGAEMRAGDTCAKADGSAVQSYEERAAAARNAAPVIVGVGLLVMAFGTGLLVADVRGVRPGPASTGVIAGA